MIFGVTLSFLVNSNFPSIISITGFILNKRPIAQEIFESLPPLKRCTKSKRVKARWESWQ